MTACVYEVTLVQGGKGRTIAVLASGVEDATAKAKTKHPQATVLTVKRTYPKE